MHVAFLDRDGTLIHEPPDGLARPEGFRILPNVIEGLRVFRSQGYTLVMITNQRFSVLPEWQSCFEETQRMLFEALKKEGLSFDEVFMCPHVDEDHCNCRKPKTGMVDRFLKEHAINKERSFVVGDNERADGGIAKAIGVRYIKMQSNGTFPEMKFS